ncbi:MAG TPA: hypothetical protein VJR89_11275, partial [Polyangiales bacterium]|nr:hypothetical protein [Polyangiales bacterium]
RYASDGPVAPEAALSEQLASLPAPARELLERVCVAGRRLPRALLLEGGVEPMAALRELRRSSTVRESLLGGSAHLEPYHDRVRELVIAQLPEPRRRELHGTLAERLKAHGAAYLDQVALHYFHAGMRAEAGAAAELAARDATQACAFHSAADLLDVALRCADSPADRRRLQLQAAEACTRAGRVLSAAQHYEAAADASDVSEQRVDLRLKALTAYCTGGHGRKGRELLSRSAAELGVAIEFDSPRFAAGVAWMARLLTVGGPRLRRSSSGEDVALRLLWQTAPALMIVDGELATQFAARAMLRAAELGERAVYGQALAFQLAVFVLVFGRSSWLHERRFAEARQLASHSADPWSERLVRVMHASARAILGHHALTLSECADIAHAQTIDAPFAASVRSGARALTLLSLLKLGRLDDFAQHVELWQAEALGSGDRHLEVTCRVFGTQRHLRAGDVARAVHELDAARAVRLDYVHSGLTEPWWPVQVALYQGDAEQAQAIYAASLAVRPDYVRYSAPMRLMYVVVDGLCAAALAASGREVEANLRRLARAARAVAGFRCTLARADAAQLAATLSHLRGERVPAERHLRAAIRGYAARGTSLHVAALQLALSQQQPADAEALARTALAAFAAQGVRDPRRWAAMVAPGWLAPLPREATRGTSSGHADV